MLLCNHPPCPPNADADHTLASAQLETDRISSPVRACAREGKGGAKEIQLGAPPLAGVGSSPTPPRDPGDRPGFRPATDLRTPLSRYYGDAGAGPAREGYSREPSRLIGADSLLGPAARILERPRDRRQPRPRMIRKSAFFTITKSSVLARNGESCRVLRRRCSCNGRSRKLFLPSPARLSRARGGSAALT